MKEESNLQEVLSVLTATLEHQIKLIDKLNKDNQTLQNRYGGEIATTESYLKKCLSLQEKNLALRADILKRDYKLAESKLKIKELERKLKEK